MQGNNLRLTPLQDGTVRVEFTLADRTQLEKLTKLTDCDLSVEIKKYRKKRSLTANAYLFNLCDKLAKVLNSTKEEVYQEAVRKVGLFEHIAIPDKAVEAFLKHWNSSGLGNYAEITEKAKGDGYTVIRTYFGSSSYNTKEFSVLLDYVIEECKAQGIEVLPQEEIDRLIDMIGE